MVEYCQIELTRGQVARVSPEDFDNLCALNWHAKLDNCGKFYASTRWIKTDGKITKMDMHRLILGDPSGSLVDHINCDTLDNRRVNLRLANKSENGRNRGPNKNNTSGFKGVTSCGSMGKYAGQYIALIQVYGKVKNLGRFHTAEAAAKAYRVAALRLHGEFARAA